MPQETIDEVEKAAPHVAKLLKTFKDNEHLLIQTAALFDQAQPLITQAQALYAKLAPLIGPAMAEIDAVMPAAQDIVAFIQQQKPEP